MHVLAGLALLMVLLCAKPADATPAEDCNQDRDLRLRIAGCTEVIRKSGLALENLSLAYTNRGVAFATLKQPSKAIADFDEAIRLDPGNVLAVYNRANVLFDLRQYGPAMEGYSHAIRLDGLFPYAYLNRGLCHEKLGQTDLAIADYTAALALDETLLGAKQGLLRLQPPQKT